MPPKVRSDFFIAISGSDVRTSETLPARGVLSAGRASDSTSTEQSGALPVTLTAPNYLANTDVEVKDWRQTVDLLVSPSCIQSTITTNGGDGAEDDQHANRENRASALPIPTRATTVGSSNCDLCKCSIQKGYPLAVC